MRSSRTEVKHQQLLSTVQKAVQTEHKFIMVLLLFPGYSLNMKDGFGFIVREIEIIDPDLIIGGIGDTSYWHMLFPNIRFLPTGYDINIANVEGRKIIDYYHPACRAPRAMSYCHLEKIISSKCFAEI